MAEEHIVGLTPERCRYLIKNSVWKDRVFKTPFYGNGGRSPQGATMILYTHLMKEGNVFNDSWVADDDAVFYAISSQLLNFGVGATIQEAFDNNFCEEMFEPIPTFTQFKITPELLAEAKERYPVGTVFYPAHLRGSESKHYCSVYEDTGLPYEQNSAIIIYQLDNRNSHSYTGVLWYHGKWAKIISKPVIQKALTTQAAHEILLASRWRGRVFCELKHWSNEQANNGKHCNLSSYLHHNDDRKFYTVIWNMMGIQHIDNYAWGGTEYHVNYFDRCFDESMFKPEVRDEVTSEIDQLDGLMNIIEAEENSIHLESKVEKLELTTIKYNKTPFTP